MKKFICVWFLVPVVIILCLTDPNVCPNERGKKFCCSGFKEENGTCEPCPRGTFGKDCSQNCPYGYYGLLCKSECNCSMADSCSPVFGCTFSGSQNDNYNKSIETPVADNIGPHKISPVLITLALLGSIILVLLVVIMSAKTDQSKKTTSAGNPCSGWFLLLYRRLPQCILKSECFTILMERHFENIFGNERTLDRLERCTDLRATEESNHTCSLARGDVYSYSFNRNSSDYNTIQLRIQNDVRGSSDCVNEDIYESKNVYVSLHQITRDRAKGMNCSNSEENWAPLCLEKTTARGKGDACRVYDNCIVQEELPLQMENTLDCNQSEENNDILSDSTVYNETRKKHRSSAMHINDEIESDCNAELTNTNSSEQTLQSTSQKYFKNVDHPRPLSVEGKNFVHNDRHGSNFSDYDLIETSCET